MATKVGISLKIDPVVRQQLEDIADREERTVSNQVSMFIKRAIAQYAESNELTWVESEARFFDIDEMTQRSRSAVSFL